MARQAEPSSCTPTPTSARMTFSFTRDYPPTDHLHQIFRMLAESPRTIEDLRAASKLSEEEFDKALEKLEIHGGARVDYAGNVTLGTPGWKKTYSIQAQFRAEQFDKVLRFTESSDCRMCALVRHFGDEEDAAQSCGRCDICDPGGLSAADVSPGNECRARIRRKRPR